MDAQFQSRRTPVSLPESADLQTCGSNRRCNPRGTFHYCLDVSLIGCQEMQRFSRTAEMELRDTQSHPRINSAWYCEKMTYQIIKGIVATKKTARSHLRA